MSGGAAYGDEKRLPREACAYMALTRLSAPTNLGGDFGRNCNMADGDYQ